MIQLYGTLVVFLAAALQSTLVTRIDVAGGRPDLMLLIVLSWAILRGPSEGIAAGIVGGFAIESLSGTPFGIHMGLLGLIGFSTSLGELNLYRGNLALFFGTAVLSTVAYHVGLALLLQVANWEPPSLARFAQVTGPTALLNALCLPAVFWLVRRGMRLLQGWRQLEV